MQNDNPEQLEELVQIANHTRRMLVEINRILARLRELTEEHQATIRTDGSTAQEVPRKSPAEP